MRSYIFILLAALLFPVSFADASVVSSSSCAVFVRNLSLGMSGEDVRVLQQLLNQEQETRVAEDGAGAPGQESTYFGAKTKRAVVNFQNRYAQEVLTPAGLTIGTGFVGVYSRASLVARCVQLSLGQSTATGVPQAEIIIPASAENPVVTPSPVSPSSANVSGLNTGLVSDNTFFHVKYPSTYVVHPGDKVTIYGGGFTEAANTLHIGDAFLLDGLTRTGLGTLEVTIPENAPKGKFDLWVENTKGVSNKSFIIITVADTLPPTIISLSTTTTQLGNTITVTGSGFTAQNNEIFSNYAKIKGVSSSDGTTLSFVFVVDIPGVTPELIPPGVSRNLSIPVSFSVVNGNGISNRTNFTVKY